MRISTSTGPTRSHHPGRPPPAPRRPLDQFPGAATELAGPAAIERCTRALGDSTGTHTDSTDVTVTLASGVTFAPDSADLAPGAEAQLQTVAGRLTGIPVTNG